MDDRKKTDTSWSHPLVDTLKKRFDETLFHGMKWFSILKAKTDNTRGHLQEVFYTTSDQVLEKAEDTRKSVKFRMAILEIEHHLNRLYPQIGKIVCDLSANGTKSWSRDAKLKSKMELAEEYRQRLQELKQELDTFQKKPETKKA